MAAQTPSPASAIFTLIGVFGVIAVVCWLAYSSISSAYSDANSPQIKPTPTPEPGTYNIDEQLDMLSQ